MSSHTVEINASVALKLSKIGSESLRDIETGPIYGLDQENQEVISVSHVMQFPAPYGGTNSYDDIFTLKSSNIKFQNDVLSKLKDSRAGAKLLGWFISSVGGKCVSQAIIEAMINLQNHNLKETKDTTPVLFLVYDPAKSLDGLLSLKAYKLSDSFLKAWRSEERFVSQNLYDNRLTYRNIYDELPITIQNSHLVNLQVLDLAPELAEDDSCLELNPATLASVSLTVEQLNESIDNFNHGLGNFNYYQRNLSRELSKVNQWKAKIKHENEEKLKLNPAAKITETEDDWSKHFRLPIQPSKYENLINSSLINNYCSSLEVDSSIELIRTAGISKGT